MSKYGCLPPKVDVRDYKVKASAKQAESYPASFSRPLYGAVKNQRNVSSCVPHATSTILENFDFGEHKLSTNFIYGMQKTISGRSEPGMYLSDACKIVQKYGDMLYEDCKGNTETPKCISPAETALADNTKAETAYKYRIDSYYSCDTENDIKYALLNYGMVLACMKMYESYTIDAAGVMHMDTDSDFGYHCVVIYGWNENGFMIQNSWGKTWGLLGYAVLPYEDHLIVEAKALIDAEPVEDPNLVRPINNKVFNVIYKLINRLIEYFKKK